MTQRHGMPPGRGPLVRAVAALAAVAMVATAGYSTLAFFSAPGWTLLLLVVLAGMAGIGLYTAQGSGR